MPGAVELADGHGHLEHGVPGAGFVAAFDVDAAKVGVDLGVALIAVGEVLIDPRPTAAPMAIAAASGLESTANSGNAEGCDCDLF